MHVYLDCIAENEEGGWWFVFVNSLHPPASSYRAIKMEKKIQGAPSMCEPLNKTSVISFIDVSCLFNPPVQPHASCLIYIVRYMLLLQYVDKLSKHR